MIYFIFLNSLSITSVVQVMILGYKLGTLREAALGFMRICAKIQTSKNGLVEEGWICTFKELK